MNSITDSNPILPHIPTNISQLSHAYLLVSNDIETHYLSLNSLSRDILCQRNEGIVEGCGYCQSCLLHQAGTHPDLLKLEELASTGIDEVRLMSSFTNTTAQISSRKVILIKDQSSLTENANNALLKTLEEPSPNTYIFMLVSSVDTVMATIKSRCHLIPLPKLSKQELLQQFPDVPAYLLSFANGAVSKLNQWQEQNNIEPFILLYQLFKHWLTGQVPTLNLIEHTELEQEKISFVLFLMQQRIRQKLIKQSGDQHNLLAMNKLMEYQQRNRDIPGMNKELALHALLNDLLPLLR